MAVTRDEIRAWLQAQPDEAVQLLKELRILVWWQEDPWHGWTLDVLGRDEDAPFALLAQPGERVWDANLACPGDCDDPIAEGGRWWPTLAEAQRAMEVEARAAGWAIAGSTAVDFLSGMHS